MPRTPTTAVLLMAEGAAWHTGAIDSQPIQEDQMATYIIEREIPGASHLNDEELRPSRRGRP
jgi:hypothetical protein